VRLARSRLLPGRREGKEECRGGEGKDAQTRRHGDAEKIRQGDEERGRQGDYRWKVSPHGLAAKTLEKLERAISSA
jgi:hypothetical protein